MTDAFIVLEKNDLFTTVATCMKAIAESAELVAIIEINYVLTIQSPSDRKVYRNL